MALETYLDLLDKQRKSMTQDQINAVLKQNRLHEIAFEKMQVRDRLENQYRELFIKGYQKLSSTPDILELLPKCDSEVEMMKALFDNVKNINSPMRNIIISMKKIPEFIECEKLNVDVAKAHFEIGRAHV